MKGKLLGALALVLCVSTSMASPVKKAIKTDKTPLKSTVVMNTEPLDLATVSRAKIQAKAIDLSLMPTRMNAPAKANEAIVLPYIEDFEDETFDETTKLPFGWSVTGASAEPFAVGCFEDYFGNLTPGASGATYLISGYDSDAARDEWAFAPKLTFEAGKKYDISVFVQAGGYDGTPDEFKLTAGTEATSEAQTTIVIDYTGENAAVIEDWTKVKGVFAPETTGEYVVAINHCTQELDVNSVAFDLLTVKELAEVAPVADFEVDTTEVKLGTFATFTSTSTNDPESLEWTIGGKVVSTEASFSYRFDVSGTYDVSLKAVNAFGEDIEVKEDFITVGDKGLTEYPYQDFLFFTDELDVVGAWDLGGSFFQAYLMTAEVGASITSCPFYMEVGKDYMLRSNMALVGAGSMTLQVMKRNDDGDLVAVSDLVTYSETESPETFFPQEIIFAPVESGNYYTQIKVTDLQGDNSVAATFGIEVFEGPYAMASLELAFGSIFVDEDSTLTGFVTNRGTGEVEVAKIESLAAPFSAALEVGATAGAGEVLKFDVTFAPTEAGSFADELVIYTTANDTLTIPVSGSAKVPFSGPMTGDVESNVNDFDLEFNGWVQHDLDGGKTYSYSGTTYPNVGYVGSFIAFNPSATDPAVSGLAAHSGDRFLACFAAIPDGIEANNDWLISPKTMINEGGKFSAYVMTANEEYGSEEFNILVSTTGTDVEDFTCISGDTPVKAPAEWTKVEYDLADYVGQEIHVAIQCVSSDQFFFGIDDIVIGGTTALDNITSDIAVRAANGTIEVEGAENVLRLYNASGVMVYENNMPNTTVRINGLQHGAYMLIVDGMSRKVAL